jgi:sigma-E factor negative regulatory protein RseC
VQQNAKPLHYLRQAAQVVALDADTVTISTVPLYACQGCAMKAGCGQQLLYRAAFCDRQPMSLPRPANIALQVGQHVQVAIPQSTMINACLRVFLLPLLTMLVMAGLAQWWFDEWLVVLCGLIGLLLGLLLMVSSVRKMSHRADWQPHLITRPKATPII